MFDNKINPKIDFLVRESNNNILEDSVYNEAVKGSITALNKSPVNIEPHFSEYSFGRVYERPGFKDTCQVDLSVPGNISEKRYLELWVRDIGKFDDTSARIDFYSSLLNTDKITYELIANDGKITEQLSLSKADYNLLLNALSTKTPWIVPKTIQQGYCEQIVLREGVKSSTHILDFSPRPPYFAALHSNSEFPLNSTFAMFQRISEQTNTSIILQIIFKPVNQSHDWQSNMKRLAAATIETQFLSRYMSNVINIGSKDIETNLKEKINYGNKFFSVAYRVLILTPVGVDGQHIVNDIVTLLNGNFMYGAYPFNVLFNDDYITGVGPESIIKESFINGDVHRPGFILNPGELAGLCSFAPLYVYEHCNDSKLNKISGLVPPSFIINPNGMTFGSKQWLGEKIKIKRPEHLRDLGLVFQGPTNCGKSYIACSCVLQGIENDHPVIVLDPHQTLSKWVAERIPRQKLEQTVYFDLCIKDFCPKYNLIGGGIEPSIVTSHVIHFLGSYFNRSWGSNIEHVYKHVIFGLATLNSAYPDIHLALSDFPTLLSITEHGKNLRDRLVLVLKNPESLRFWTEEFKTYRQVDLRRISNKFSELFLITTVRKLFSQSGSDINIQDIIDNNKILLVNLPPDDNMSTELVGACLIEDIYNTVKSQKHISAGKPPVLLVIDELENFKSSGLIQILPIETRKFGLIPWYILHYIPENMRHLLNNFGAIISLGIDMNQHDDPVKGFKNIIFSNEVLGNGVPGKAVAYFAGGHIVDFETEPLCKPVNSMEQIINYSLKKYYVNESELLKNKKEYIEPGQEIDFKSWEKDL